MRIRPVVDGEDLDVVHADNPYWFGSHDFWAVMRAAAVTSPSYSWVAEGSDRSLVGHATVFCEAVRRPDQARGFVWVSPSARRQRVGTAMHAQVMRTATENGFPRVLMSAQDAQPGSVEAAQTWGGHEDGYHHEQTLDLTTLSDTQVNAWCEPATAYGVTLHGVSGVDELEMLYPFCRDRFDEAPDMGDESEPLSKELFLVFAKPERMLVARRGAEVVGFTSFAMRLGSPPAANIEFTGVHPDHRGHGIALALKAEHARRMRDDGVAVVYTQNMDENGPILAVNTRMGFVRQPGRTDFWFPALP